MLRRKTKALQIYRWMISWGEKRIAYEECGEGIRSARSLIADCYYRIGRIHEERREWQNALGAYSQHLRRRKPGVWSIYPLAEVRRRVAELDARDPSRRTLRISAAGSRFAHARKAPQLWSR